jgi:hypothetical protein
MDRSCGTTRWACPWGQRRQMADQSETIDALLAHESAGEGLSTRLAKALSEQHLSWLVQIHVGSET